MLHPLSNRVAQEAVPSLIGQSSRNDCEPVPSHRLSVPAMIPSMKLICEIRWLRVLLVCAVIAANVSLAQADDQLTPEQIKFFEAKIRPVLVRECYSCHSNQVGQVKGGLWLDTKDGIRVGGDSGPAVVPGNLEESILWNAINHFDYAMPPRQKLSDEILHDFREWIEMGAPDPRENPDATIRSAITPEQITAGREFWSFQPLKPVSVPALTNDPWSKLELDAFVIQKLRAAGLEPALDAVPSTLLRRLCFDLIGLPPTPSQIQKFETEYQKDADAAVEKVVDELLASPQFGERWGRHWLDVARYAESSGRELNMTFPHAWRYRDYVIDSFNEDKPYNQFIIEQLAGDLLPIDSDEQWARNLIATGFLVVGPKTLREQNPRQFELDLIDEQLDVTTRVMLGVSVACARCHDHKFDPIPQTDYYSLAGIFRGMSTHYGTAAGLQNRRASNLIVLPIDDLNPGDKKIAPAQLTKLKQELADKQTELREALRARAARNRNDSSMAENRNLIARIPSLSTAISALESQIHAYDEKGNPLSFCMAVQETSPQNMRLLERGELNKPAQEVKRGFPQVLCSSPPLIPPQSTGRLEFALWIGDEQNPLTARVMVNRIWQHLFGNGIVRTPDDFGSTGDPPTHPELLDYLANSFIQNHWSVKQQIRAIVLSRTYRMSSQFNKASFLSDPENRLLWRMEPRRLSAEAIRDAMLAVSGKLDTQRPRASIVAAVGHAQVNRGTILAAQVMNGDETEDAMTSDPPRMRGGMGGMLQDSSLRPRLVAIDQPVNYRSVYLPIIREQIPRSLEVFDFAESTLVISQRETSHTPDQGLYFLNNLTVIELADSMAEQLIRQSKNPKQQIKSAFLLAYGRRPTETELKAAIQFYDKLDLAQARGEPSSRAAARRERRQPAQSAPNNNRMTSDDDLLRLSAVCQAIMAAAEFRMVN